MDQEEILNQEEMLDTFEGTEGKSLKKEILRDRFREEKTFTNLDQAWSYSHDNVRKIAYICYSGSAQLTVRQYSSQGRVIHQSPINAGDQYHKPKEWGTVHVEFTPTSVPTRIYMHVEWH